MVIASLFGCEAIIYRMDTVVYQFVISFCYILMRF